MELTWTSDSTNLDYWLRWEFFFCLLSVLSSVIIASFLIRKYEGSENTERAFSVYDGEAWMPCVKGLSPLWLMSFRIISSCLLLAASIADVASHGTNLFYYYTQWTLILTTIYFLFGSLLSVCGSFRKHKICNAYTKGIDAEEGIYEPLTHTETEMTLNQQMECYFSQRGAIWGYILQIVFQMTAGAVMLTDGVYWLVIFPFLTIADYEMSFRFPWFRISYFILFTAVYVVFEWIVHAFVETWWPYPFLDVSAEFAPAWYWLVAALHLPCYAMFVYLVKAKYLVLSRWFPESYQSLR